MSFGFSVGDFVACIVLIKNVAQALDASTGSAAEVKNLVEILNSLKQGIITSEVVWQQWTKGAFEVDGEVESLITSVIEGIQAERGKCVELLEAFLASLKPYTEALICGRGTVFAKRARKITWLLRKEDVISLQRSVNGHLRALNIHIATLSQLLLFNNARTGMDILDTVNALRKDVAIIANSIHKGVPSPMNHLGGPWESQSCMNDVVYLIDAIGRRLILPIMLLGDEKDLHRILIVLYRNIPGQRQIQRKEYNITDEDSDGALVKTSNWNQAIQPGKQLLLNIILPASSSMDPQRCPRCLSAALKGNLPGDRKRCQKCQLTFKIVDKERYIDAESEKPISSSPPQLKDGQKYDHKPKQISNVSKPFQHPGTITRESNTIDLGNDRLVFHNIQFHRDIWHVRKIHSGDDEIYEIDFNKLPALHKAAAEGDLTEINRQLDMGVDIDAPLLSDVRFTYSETRYYDMQGCTALHLACFYGHVKALQLLIGCGADINAQDEDGAQPVYYAIAGLAPEKVWFPLLAHGAEIHLKNEVGQPFIGTLLHEACYSGHAWLVNYLIDEGVDINAGDQFDWTPVQNALIRGHSAAFEILLDNDADLKTRKAELFCDPLHLASIGGSGSITTNLLGRGHDPSARDYKKNTPLHVAGEHGSIEPAKILVAAGVDTSPVNDFLNTPLHLASSAGHLEMVDFLIEKGADLQTSNTAGETPLHLACLNAHADVVKSLLKAGAQPSGHDWCGNSVLHNTCFKGNLQIISLILDADLTNINERSRSGRTPLHIAAENGHPAVIELLFSKGADQSILTGADDTPLHLATKEGHLAAVKELMRHDTATLNDKAWPGNNALTLASYNGHPEIASFLLGIGADVHSQNDRQETPIHDAAWNGNVEILKLLIDHGANINGRAADDVTPLRYALEQNREDAVRLLLDSGAAIDERDKTWWALLVRCWERDDEVDGKKNIIKLGNDIFAGKGKEKATPVIEGA